MLCLLRGWRIQLILVLILIGVFALPVKARRRVVVLAKTPIVLPADKTNVYSDQYYRKYERLILAASEEFDVPAPLIAAVIKAESNYRPNVRSRAGAMGLMQMMRGTWAHVGGVGSPYNPGQNIRMGTKYLKMLLDQFNGNLVLTIAAYNAGPNAVKKFRRVPPYRETRRYVPKVLRYYRKYKKMIKVS
jgi:soluble lytic murein transglycosylase-like protein